MKTFSASNISRSMMIALALLLPTTAAVAVDESDRPAIEKMIRNYLITNPQILLEVQQALEEKQRQEAQQKAKETLAANSETIFNSPNQGIIGNAKGDVTVVEFFDYNCGYCKRAVPDVLRLLGSGRLEVHCVDGKKRTCTIRGSKRNRVWCHAGDIVLIGLRDFGDESKADVMLKYYEIEARELQELGELPESIRIAEGGYFSDEEEEDGFDGAAGSDDDEEEKKPEPKKLAAAAKKDDSSSSSSDSSDSDSSDDEDEKEEEEV